MRKPPLQHDARRDTMWVGKGAGPVWLIVTGIAAAAVLAYGLFH